ncbi:MAG: M56 family metallopeptidase, partial [Flavobacteriaceae bacterium]
MITYFLKSFVCLALLLAFYNLVLEREKMHQFNRFYLLGSIVFSFIAPLYKIYKEATQTIVEVIQPVILDNAPMIEITEPIKEVNYLQYVYIPYLIVSLILTIRFIKNLLAIYLKTKQHQKIKKGKATLVLVDDLISPHTFWNYIFINKDEYNSNKIETELYTHELTHALQKHTFDILLIELLQIIFWINPTYILLKKAIKLNHEFLADNNVITTHKNTSEYQYLLLNRTTW